MQNAADRPVEIKGHKRIIAYAMLRNGKCPAKDFLENLNRSDRATLAKFLVLFRRMANEGIIQNKQQYRKVQGEIWEFKRYQHRIGCYQDGRILVLTHGFIKKRDKWPKEELKRANRIAQEDKARIAEKGKRRK